jgi:hypothetical protein
VAPGSAGELVRQRLRAAGREAGRGAGRRAWLLAFYGARGGGRPRRARQGSRPGGGGVLAVPTTAAGQMGPVRPTAGPARTWVGPSGSAQLDRIVFLNLKYILSTKEFQRNSSNSFKALKILKKSQNFQENS